MGKAPMPPVPGTMDTRREKKPSAQAMGRMSQAYNKQNLKAEAQNNYRAVNGWVGETQLSRGTIKDPKGYAGISPTPPGGARPEGKAAGMPKSLHDHADEMHPLKGKKK